MTNNQARIISGIVLLTLISSVAIYKIAKKPIIGDYSKDKEGVYYYGVLLPMADQKTFETLDEFYAKDKNNVYKEGQILPDRDASSFEVINEVYTKDNRGVYWEDEIRKELDPKTFLVWGGDLFFLAKDKNGIYYYNNKIAGADLATFEPISRPYYKDQHHIYIEDLDQIVRLVGAHRENFEVLSGMYAKDKDSIYYWGEVVKGADVNTFRVVDGIAKDKDSVFFLEKKISGADPETFFMIGNDYGGDRNTVYKRGQKIEGVDPETFIVLNDYYAKDKNFGYFEGVVIQNSDGGSFTIFAEKEGETTLFEYEEEGGRMVTAITSKQVFAKDKKYVYHLGEIIQGVIPDSF